MEKVLKVLSAAGAILVAASEILKEYNKYTESKKEGEAKAATDCGTPEASN